MFKCIKSFSYKINISANQVSNALRMKALGNTKPDTPKIAGNFFANKFTIHLSKNHPFGGTNLPILTELLKTQQTARF
mgnify:CR=1 FL=1